MSKAVVQSVLSFMVIVFSLGGVATAGAHEGEEVVSGEWIEERLTVRYDSNWSTEHCFSSPGGSQVRYQFSSAIALAFDFHVHPVTGDGGYRTEHLDQAAGVRTHKGQAEASLPGTYCFDFVPVNRGGADSEILLRYRIDFTS